MEKHESDMTPKEKRQAERAKLRGMSPGEKAGYLWTYYKIWLFIPIVLIIVIWQGVQIYHNAQEVELLSVGVADTDLETEEGKSALESDLLEALGTGDEHEVITLDTGISSGEDSASVMKRADCDRGGHHGYADLRGRTLRRVRLSGRVCGLGGDSGERIMENYADCFDNGRLDLSKSARWDSYRLVSYEPVYAGVFFRLR